MARKILLSDHDAAKEAAKEVLLADGLVIYPTDTLYGLGCNALSEKAVEKIYSLKKREGRKPLSVIVFDYEMICKYCSLGKKQEKILHALLPGPYTFILPLKKEMPVASGMAVGVRVPEHFFMRQVSRELMLPIVSTSANISGEKDAAAISDVDRSVLEGADLALDGGKCKYAQGSTVIDLIEMKVLRKGAVREGDRIEF